MKISTVIVVSFLAIASMIGVFGMVTIVQIQEISQPIKEDIPANIREVNETSRLDSLAQFIRYYDEVLTQSARNYAFTGDAKWKDRYNAFVPDLDAAIKSAIELGDDEDREIFRSIDQSNLYLVDLEVASMDLVDRGRRDEAVAILDSAIYQGNKSVYEEGLRGYVQRRGFLYNQSIFASTEALDRLAMDDTYAVDSTMRTVIAFVVATMVAAVLLGFYLTGLVSKPLRRLTEVVDKVSRGEFDVDITESSSIEEVRILIDSMKRIMKTMKLAVLDSNEKGQ